jgi:hypothetical protein
MRFSFLTGDVNYTTYGGKWISPRQSNGEFDYYFVIELLNWRETVGEREPPPETYNVSLSVVSPQQAEKEIPHALECCGITEEMLATATDNGQRDTALVEALHSYGVYTPVWSKDGNNWRALMREARQEARQCEFLFGFYLDRPVNRIGTSGWESLRGDLTSALYREQPPCN